MPNECISKMRVVFDLYEEAERMIRGKIMREHPGATDAEVERLVVEWLRRRPGAEHGDASGTGLRPSNRLP